jgi:hypothetical protein
LPTGLEVADREDIRKATAGLNSFITRAVDNTLSREEFVQRLRGFDVSSEIFVTNNYGLPLVSILEDMGIINSLPFQNNRWRKNRTIEALALVELQRTWLGRPCSVGLRTLATKGKSLPS